MVHVILGDRYIAVEEKWCRLIAEVTDSVIGEEACTLGREGRGWRD